MSVADDLLRHLGLDPSAPPPATREGLRIVHRAYVGTVPYEALAVQLGETQPLDPHRLAQRILSGRGGYCFEVNAVLHLLLTHLGFDARMHQARVDPPGPTNHMALVVTHADGSRHIADAGLGEGSLDPVPLAPGTYGDPFAWRVEERGDGWWVEGHEWTSFDGFEVRPQASALADFDPHHARLATDPESHFVTTLVAQRPADTTITSLRSRTLSVAGPGRDKDARVLADADDLDATLRGTFGIMLDEQRVAKLWANATQQHEDFLRRAA